MPRLGTVRSWRRRAPREFTFSVKCNHVATHVQGLRPVEETFSILKSMFMVCRMLRSEMLVLQTPPSLKVDEDKVQEVSSILKNLNPGQIQIFWEIRTPLEHEAGLKVRRTMVNEGIIPIVDLTRESPLSGLDVIYSRLFSLGPVEYSYEHIEEIDRRLTQAKAERVVLAFHGAPMYRDALRYLEFRRQ